MTFQALRDFRKSTVAGLLATCCLVFSVLSGPPAMADARDTGPIAAAARRVLERQREAAPESGRALRSLKGIAGVSAGLARSARKEFSGGTTPATSESLQQLLRERSGLRAVNEALSEVLAEHPGREVSTSTSRRAKQSRRTGRASTHRLDAGSAATTEVVDLLYHVEQLLALEDQVEDMVRMDSRWGAVNLLRRIEVAAQRIDDLIDLGSRTSRVVRRPAPEVRMDPVPHDAAAAAPAGAATLVEVPGNQEAAIQITPEITALAAQLEFDPLQIFLHVRDNYHFETYFGLLKGAQATLETQAGNDYDLAALTGSLLSASGYNVRFGRGTAIIPADAIVEWLGLEDAAAANSILNTAGINAVPVVSGPDIVEYRVDRLWVEVETSLRPGDAPVWLPLDPAFKRHDLTSGVTGLLAAVPFDESTYLSVTRTELTYEFYAQQIQDYLDTNQPGTTLADVPLEQTPAPDDLGRLPRSLPYRLYTFDTIYSTLPDTLAHKATIRVRYLGGTEFSHPIVLPDTVLQRMTVSYIVNPADQGIVDGFGGLANTPPGAVDVIPQLKLDGLLAAQGGLIPYLDPVTLEVDFFKPEGDVPDGTEVHTVRAGEWAAVGIDAFQISHTHLQRQIDDIVAAIAIEDSGGSADPDDLVGAFLYLAIMQYHDLVKIGDETLNGLAQFRQVRLVSEGIASSNQDIVSVGGLPFTTLPNGLVVDVPRLNRSSFALDDDNTLRPELRRIAGFNGSAQEHGIWESYLNLAGISTIKSLQLANEGGIPVFVIDDNDADPNNDCSILCPQLTLAASTVSAIQSDVASGNRVTVPRDPTPLNSWSGVGYITEDPIGGSVGYIISGGLSSILGEPDLPDPFDHAGGGQTIVLIDGQVYIIPAGVLGDGPGQSFTGDPVNIANGNFFRQEVDFSIPALAEPLSIRRYYNSQSTYDGPFGIGWTHQYGDLVELQPDESVIWVDSRGTAYTFLPDVTPGTYLTPPGLRYELTSNASSYTLRRYDGWTLGFDADGKLVSRTDRNSNGFTLSYDGLDRLSTVADPASRTLTLTYTASDRVDTVTDFTGRTWDYDYDGNDRLSMVTSPSDAQTQALVTQYVYDGLDRLAQVTEPNAGQRHIRYYSNGRVAEVIDPEGGMMSLVYNEFKAETAVTDERGLTRIHGFNSNGNQTSLRHPDGTLERWTYVDNRMTSYTDGLGNTIVYEYTNENLTRKVEPTGRETTYVYDPVFASVTSMTLPGMRLFTNLYDSNGNLTDAQMPGGVTRTLVPGSTGLPDSVTDANNVTTTLTYNVDGQVATRTTPLSFSETFIYDPRGTVDRFIDANSHEKLFEYDLLDRVLTLANAAGNSEQHEYDAAGRLVRIIDARGSLTQFEYDLKGRLVRQVNPDSSEKLWNYDPVGNLVAETDELGRTTRHTYDSRNRRIKSRFPDGGEVRQRYDPVGRLIATTDPRGNTTRFEYDASGRLTRSIDALGNDGVRTYDAAGSLETLTDRRGALTEFEYDPLQRTNQILGEEGRLITRDYDGNGNLLDETNYDLTGVGSLPPDPRTLPDSIKRSMVQVFDDRNRVDTRTDPEGGVTEFGYDTVGNILTVTDPNLKTTTYEYTSTDRVDKVIQPDLGQTSIEYDAVGNRTRLTTPTGGEYHWTYDQRNRVTSYTDPLGNTTLYEYDLVGNLVRQLNPDGTWVRRSYDPMNRLRRVQRSDSTFSERTYDLAGNVVRAVTEKTVLEFTYDALNRDVSETLSIPSAGFTQSVGYQYDEESNLETLTDPTGRVLTYGHDLTGQLSSVTSSTRGLMVDITRDGYGQRGTIAYGNGASGSLLFDKNARPTTIDWNATVARFIYNRDDAGNPLTIQESLNSVSETLTIGYDDLNRPTSSVAGVSPGTRSESFGYDLNGNPTNAGSGVTATFNLANQAISFGGDTLNYDRRGNRTSRTPTAGSPIEITYDPEDRFTSMRQGASTTRVTYDAFERVVEIDVDGTVTRILNAKQNRLVEYDGAGAVSALYTMTGRADDVFAVESGGGLYYLHTDAIGSVRAVTDGGGSVVGTRDYGLFGRQLATSGSPPVALGFTARPSYLNGELIDLRARLYDPAVGTFLSTDPLGVLSSFPNPYSYAGNRPGMFVDPLGLSPEGPSLSSRLFGVLGLIGGVGEVILGAAGIVAPEPLTTAGGVLLVGHGLDTAQANLRQIWTGESMRTLTSQGLSEGAELLGASETTALYIGEFGDAGVSIVLTLGTTAGLQSGRITQTVVQTGDNVVYQSIDNVTGQIEYVGITNNIERRAAEHLGDVGRVVDAVPGLSNLSRTDARSVEQVLIELHGLGKNGGTLSNRINSIARTNPDYAASIERGAEILGIVNYTSP